MSSAPMDGPAARREAYAGQGARRLEEAGHDGRVSLADVLETFADCSLGVLLAVFGLIAAMPVVGDIAGISVLILLSVTRSLSGRGSMQLPGRVGRRSMERMRLARVRPRTDRIDRTLHRKRRLHPLTG